MVSDQAERLRAKTTKFVHLNLARLLVLVGFSLLGVTLGVFFAVFGSLVGSAYQLLKVLMLFGKVAFRCETRIDEMHPPATSPMPMLDISDTSITYDTRSQGLQPQLMNAGPRRMLCCIRLPNTCPECFAPAFKSDNDNAMTCLICRAAWCWTCRKRVDQSSVGEQHFEWYNVFGCPGLQHTPDYFLIGLAAKLLVSLLSPLVLLFAPLVVAMANYKPGANIVKDQAVRFKANRSLPIHMNVAKGISLLGFSILGLAVAGLIVPILSPIAILYQLLTVCVLFCRGVCGSKGIREDDDASDFDSPVKSSYQTLASSHENNAAKLDHLQSNRPKAFTVGEAHFANIGEIVSPGFSALNFDDADIVSPLRRGGHAGAREAMS